MVASAPGEMQWKVAFCHGSAAQYSRKRVTAVPSDDGPARHRNGCSESCPTRTADRQTHKKLAFWLAQACCTGKLSVKNEERLPSSQSLSLHTHTWYSSQIQSTSHGLAAAGSKMSVNTCADRQRC
jgi:hypothetical protein